ncbi:hypothetical protein [Treponema sp.]|uniref:hypothetical protein n=1 Tax=Treponema sp. TaxID=166 RepID=UPI00298E4841|nr:hypothetical protein [Treponema sp.]MCR5613748.1 hypothetical protein [Treponema sp.]
MRCNCNVSEQKSDSYTYDRYFGQTPIGRPYTYQEFNNIREDFDNPAYAQVYVAQ